VADGVSSEEMHSRFSRPPISRLDEALRAAWRLMTSPGTLMATLGVLLLFVLAGVLVPQEGDLSDVALAQQVGWLAALRARSPTLANVVQASGVMHLYQSLLFRLLLAWIAALCVVGLLALVTRDRSSSPKQVYAWTFGLQDEASEVWMRVGEALSGAGLQRPEPTCVDGCQVAAMRRRGVRGWATALAYAGVLVLLAASLIASRWGWRSADITLLLGEPQALAPNTGLTARLDEIRLIPGGEKRSYQVESVLALTGEGVSKAVTLDQTNGTRSDGLSLYQIEEGPSLRLQVRDSRGQCLDITDPLAQLRPAPVVRRALRGSQQEQQYLVPAADLVVNVVHFSRRLGAETTTEPLKTALQVQAVRWSDGELLLDELLESDAVLSVPGPVEADATQVVVAFERYVVLRAEREPERLVALFGAGLVLLGLLAGLLWPERRAWAVVCPGASGCRCCIEVPARDANAPWVARLQSALGQRGGETL